LLEQFAAFIYSSLHLYTFARHFHANIENQYFVRLPTFPVVICRQCQYGVWPNSIASHLKGSAHQVKHKEAQQVQEAIQQWDGIQHDSSQLELPLVLDERIPQLPIYPEGLLCWREYPQCRFIARSMETMKCDELRLIDTKKQSSSCIREY
jgi:hypothetical protein